MKIFTILFIFLFFTALGFSIHPDKKWILVDYYFNAGDVWPTVPNSDGVGISRVWTLSEGHIYCDIVYDQTRYPGVWGNCWWDVGKYNYRSSSSSYNEYDRANTDLRLNPDYGVYSKPVWIGTPQTGQIITQGTSKYIDLAHFSPECTDYTFSGSNAARVGSTLQINCPSGYTNQTLSGTFKGLKDGVWSDDVSYSFNVVTSLPTATVITLGSNKANLDAIFPDTPNAANYVFTGSDGSTISATDENHYSGEFKAGMTYIAKAFDSQGNLLQERSYTHYDPKVISTSSMSNPSTVRSAPNTSIAYQANPNGVHGNYYQLDPNNPSSKWLTIDSKTGAVTGTPPAGTGEYSFDVYEIPSKTVDGSVMPDYENAKKKTVYGNVVEPNSTAPVVNTIAQADQANNTSSIVNNQINQTQVFNNMNQLLQTISNNTSSGGGSTVDMTATNAILSDIRTAVTEASTVDMTPPEDTSSTIAERNASTSIKVDFIQSHLTKSYSQNAPIFTIPLSTIEVGTFYPFPDWVLDFNDTTLLTLVHGVRAFFLGCVVIWALVMVIKIIKSFEF